MHGNVVIKIRHAHNLMATVNIFLIVNVYQICFMLKNNDIDTNHNIICVSSYFFILKNIKKIGKGITHCIDTFLFLVFLFEIKFRAKQQLLKKNSYLVCIYPSKIS